MKTIFYYTKRAFLFLFAGVPLQSQTDYNKLKGEIDNYLRKSPKEHMASDYRNVGRDMYSALDKYKTTHQE